MNFGEFLPDQPEYNNPGSPYVLNVIPASNCYLPFPSFSAVGTSAINARPQGAFATKKADSSVFITIGNATKLYKQIGTTLTDITRSSGGDYACGSDDRWKFAQFGNRILATQISDDIQYFDLTSSTNYAKLATSTLQPKAKYIMIVGDFPVIGFTNESSTNYPYRIRWPKITDIADFDESATNQSGHQDLPDASNITGLAGNGKSGIILTEKMLHRMDYVGGSLIFTFDKVTDSIGCQLPPSVISHKENIFYYSTEGWVRFNGVETEYIGDEKIDRFFADDFDLNYRYRLSTAIYPENKLLLISYPGKGNVSGTPNKILCYRWDLKKWGYAELTLGMIFNSLSQGFTLEDLSNISSSLDDLPASLDSDIWQGGRNIAGGFNSSHILGGLAGSSLDAVITTAEFAPISGMKSYIDSVRPTIDGTSATLVTVEDITRDRLIDVATENGETSVETTGEAFVMQSARYHKFKIRITGGFNKAIGIDDIDAVADGSI